MSIRFKIVAPVCFWLLVGAVGCSDDTRPGAGGGDTSVEGDVRRELDGSADDAGNLDTGGDGATPDAEFDVGEATDTTDTGDSTGAAGCSFLDVGLADGTTFTAQLIATYDHRLWWWNAADRTTLGFFRPSAYGLYPADDSFEFVGLDDVVAMESTARPDDARCYTSFVRAFDFTVDALPLEGRTQILMGNSGYHRYEGGYGDFAWDFTRVDETGARYEGEGDANSDYLVWDERVYAPVSGYVVEVVRDAPDHPPGDYPEGAENNLVGIHLGGSYYIYLLHLKQGSIPADVQPETYVDVGDYLGRVGNSGVTLEPHLHLTLLWHDEDAAEPRSWSVPTEFEDIEVAPTPRGPFERRTYVVPETGESVRAVE